jgi:hypothetical protein
MPRLILMGISKRSFVIKGFRDLIFCFFCFKTKEIAEGKNVHQLKSLDESQENCALNE